VKYAYYPGCSLNATGIEYNISSKAVARYFGVELKEIDDWNCCGASAAHNTNHWLSLALPARNLAIAEKEGLDIAVPCAACYSRLKGAQVAVTESAATKETIKDIIEMDYQGSGAVLSMVDVVHQGIGLEKLKEGVKLPLEGLKVASYYGCLLVRPKKLAMDDQENPMKMDEIMASIGAEPVDWAYKVECCGAGHSTQKTQVGFKMINDILINAKLAGANCIVSACPLCMLNLDMRQKDLKQDNGEDYNLPVFYFTELVGMAVGYTPEEMGVPKHFTDAIPLLVEKNLYPAGRRDA
jgi:heterodisulfide reductase subunit B